MLPIGVSDINYGLNSLFGSKVLTSRYE